MSMPTAPPFRDASSVSSFLRVSSACFLGIIPQRGSATPGSAPRMSFGSSVAGPPAAAADMLGAGALALVGVTRCGGGAPAGGVGERAGDGELLAALVAAAVTAGGRDLGAPDCGATTLAVPGGGKPAGGAGAMGDGCVRAPDGCMAPGSVWPARGVPW